MTSRSSAISAMLMTTVACLWLVGSVYGLSSDYEFEVIARTGVALDGSGNIGGTEPIIGLGTGPSINDSGKVAFIARDQGDFAGRVIVVGGNVVERNYPVEAPATVGDYVQINDMEQVIFHQGFDDGLVSHIQRLDTKTGGQTIASGSYTFRFEAPFLEVLPWVTLSHIGGQHTYSRTAYRGTAYLFLLRLWR